MNRPLTYQEFKDLFRSLQYIQDDETKQYIKDLLIDANLEHHDYLNMQTKSHIEALCWAYNKGLLSKDNDHFATVQRYIHHVEMARSINDSIDNLENKQCPLDGHFIAPNPMAMLELYDRRDCSSHNAELTYKTLFTAVQDGILKGDLQ